MADFGIVEGVLIAAAVASAATAAYASYESGQQAQKAARYNSQVADIEAQQAKDAAAIQESNYREETRHRQAAARAARGATGVTTEGSPLLVLMDSAQQAELEAQRIKYGGEVAATGYQSQAAYQRYAGRQAAQAGAYGAGVSLLGSAASGAKAYYGSQYRGAPARVASSEIYGI